MPRAIHSSPSPGDPLDTSRRSPFACRGELEFSAAGRQSPAAQAQGHDQDATDAEVRRVGEI